MAIFSIFMGCWNSDSMLLEMLTVLKKNQQKLEEVPRLQTLYIF